MLIPQRKADVLVILTNYMRPSNIPIILDAFETGTVKPSKIVVVDNHQLPEYKLPNIEGRVYDIFRFKKNMGPPCRFVGAIGDWDEQYILFIDDDMLPDVNFLEEMMLDASKLNFSTLGVVGRSIVDGVYVFRDVEREKFPVKVDVTCRCNLIKKEFFPYALKFRNEIKDKSVRFEDDFLLCCGIQRETGYNSYVGNDKYKYVNLPAPHAWSHREKHRVIRQRFLTEAAKHGWTSLL